MTEYEYDGDGRLIRSVAAPEQEWTPEQRGWALALAEYRAARCPCGCGQDARESLNPDTAGEWKVPAPVRCHARTAISIAQKSVLDAGNPQPEALLYHAERR